MEVEEWLNNNQFGIDIWKNKYQFENETLDEWFDRVSGEDKDVRRLIEEKKFLFGGRVLANRRINLGYKATLANCYVIPVYDNLESIFKTAGEIARTYSYGGGCGICISNLCPSGAKVNNTAKYSSGAVSFADLYNTTTGLIGQLSRRGALMLSMSSEHPDIEEFIDAKINTDKLTKCNMSVMASDKFMKMIDNNISDYKLSFTRETGEVIEKIINPKQLFHKLVYNNWISGEPGLLFWDMVNKWSMLSNYETFSLEGINPCGELPLPAYGACCLGSINLIEYIKNNKFDFETFKQDISIVVKAMNDVLDEGIPLHPLKEQQECVAKWRQIGIGIFSWASMLMKLGIKYGSDESLELADKIAKTMINEAVRASAILAKEHGKFPVYNYEYLIKSKFYQENIDQGVKDIVSQYGLRNSQLLSIAPTGSLSSLFGVSGGLEPLFNTSYERKTESLHNDSVSYKIYDKTVENIMKKLNITDEKDFPEYIICSQDIPYIDRIKMQAVWQKYIDASISSTVNLPNSATQEDIYNLYIEAWKAGLKGITVYRDGCARQGILSTTSELKRGDWKPIAKDTIYDKIKLKTGCGELMLFPGWSDSEQSFQEVWIKQIGTGGCERSIEAIAIEASAIFRLGGQLYNIEKSFEKLETCPSFKDARRNGKRLSKGNSCADCILKALQKYENDKKKLNVNVSQNEIKNIQENICPECGVKLIATGGCFSCLECGFSRCG